MMDEMNIARANMGKARQIVNARSHLGTQLVEIGKSTVL